MIALRLIIVGVLIVIVALALAWLMTRDVKYLSWIRRVLYFASDRRLDLRHALCGGTRGFALKFKIYLTGAGLAY